MRTVTTDDAIAVAYAVDPTVAVTGAIRIVIAATHGDVERSRGAGAHGTSWWAEGLEAPKASSLVYDSVGSVVA
jgi:hypothetical protein